MGPLWAVVCSADTVIPAWVPHGAWTTDTSCLEVDVFTPPRKTLLGLAGGQDVEDPA